MSTPNEIQESVAGVTARRKRSLDEAEALSPPGDQPDRKRVKLNTVSVPLRRSPRLASTVASKAQKYQTYTRHPESDVEAQSSSHSSTLDEDRECSPASIFEDTHQRSDPCNSAVSITPHSSPIASCSQAACSVEIIDLTDTPIIAQKRKWIADDDAETAVRITMKKARLETTIDEDVPGEFLKLPPSTPPSSESSHSIPTVEAVSVTNCPPEATTSASSHADAPRIKTSVEDEQKEHKVTAQNDHVADEVSEAFTSPLDTLSGQDSQQSNDGTATALEDTTGSHSHTLETVSSVTLTSGELDLPPSPELPTPFDKDYAEDITQHDLIKSVESSGDEVGITFDPSAGDSVDLSLESTSPSNAVPDRQCSPKPSSCRYFAVDLRFLRSRKPPSSYLAPNPVRRAPRSETGRRDECRYLSHATQRAGLIAFAQTRRQFPRWMQRPSHVYFRGSEFFPRGRPATEQEKAAGEIGVGVDVENILTSSTPQDAFLSLPTQFQQSTSTHTPPQLELDPDLDPSLLLNTQAPFYTHGVAMDFLGPGAEPSAQSASSLDGSLQQPQDQLWFSCGTSSQVQDSLVSGFASAGPSNMSAFQTVSSRASIVGTPGDAGKSQGDSHELTLTPMPFSLFGVPPLPLPAQHMSLDSSLSAMAAYLVNETSIVNLNSTSLIDGVAPVAPSFRQSYPPPISHMESSSVAITFHHTFEDISLSSRRPSGIDSVPN